MTEAPKKIYARKPSSECVISFSTPSEDYNIEYVRADLFNRYYSYLDAIETECSFAVDPENYTHEDVVKLIDSLWNVLGLAKTALNDE